MKHLAKFILLAFCLSIWSSCNETELQNEEELTPELKSSKNEMVTVGFNLVFTGNYDYQGPDVGICGDFPPMIRVINNGEGSGTHMGKLSSHFDFCVDITDSTYPHGHMEAWFIDENGDELWVSVAGVVIPGRLPGMPSYATSYFRDPFVILGGTGRFEGATGEGWTNDYNSSMDDQSHHHWKGKIKMKKGKS